MYTVPEKISQAEYALNTAVTLLDFYDDYFDIPYPLPKHGECESSGVTIFTAGENGMHTLVCDLA